MKKEIWFDVPEWEGFYQINGTFDKFRSVDRIVETKNGVHMPIKGVEMKIRINGSGYRAICVSRNNRRTSVLIHRIKALLQIPNPENKAQVNHIYGNKLDNENIEWSTPKENTQHAFRIGLKSNKGEKNPMFGKRGPETGMYGRKGASHPMFGRKGESHPTYGKRAKGSNNAASKIVLDLQTGIFYDTAKEAAFARNMKPTTLRGHLNGTTKVNNTSLIYA